MCMCAHSERHTHTTPQQVYDNGNAYLHSGMYTFELGDADARTPVEARFSYVWRKVRAHAPHFMYMYMYMYVMYMYTLSFSLFFPLPPSPTRSLADI